MPDTEKEPEDITEELQALSKADDEPEDIAESQESKLRRFRTWYVSHKKKSVPLTVLFVLLLLLAVPFTRYFLLGTIIKKDVNVVVVDQQMHVPVSGADISLRGKTERTDGQGHATLRGVPVGNATLQVTKKYYRDYNGKVTVGLGKAHDVDVTLTATGRQIAVHVTNKISGAALAGTTLKIADTETQTDAQGNLTVVLPVDKPAQTGTLTLKGYNDLSVTFDLSKTNVTDNNFTLTPTGKVYFLSKRTGKIDVVKTDLDGGNRQVVLPGTGQEEDGNTVLLASRDWKYLALQARRENGQSRLYLIDTHNDSLLEIDSGDVFFNLSGWSDHNFVYSVSHNNQPSWQPKANVLKSYNADTKQLAVIDETSAEGTSNYDYIQETFGAVTILKTGIVYSKSWNNGTSAYRLAGKSMAIYATKPDGSNKQAIKTFDNSSFQYITTVQSKPEEVYFQILVGSSNTYYEYANGKLSASSDLNTDTFNKPYSTYLVSPGGSNVFWFEPRDGKNALFTANTALDSPKQLLTASEYTPYGWYGEDYLLVSKSGSELYVMPAGGTDKGGQVLKVTDYHKPQVSFGGYGYGYGGL